jgi:hypothetical protein
MSGNGKIWNIAGTFQYLAVAGKLIVEGRQFPGALAGNSNNNK